MRRGGVQIPNFGFTFLCSPDEILERVFDRAEYASVELLPRDHRLVVVKPNAGGALQRLSLNSCGGEALGESARSIRWREWAIRAGVTGEERHVVKQFDRMNV
jgi:hypothetical protein